MNWQKWVGAAACAVLIISCFMHWAYYPDIQKYFTGFNTWTFIPQKGIWGHYYGRPGILLVPFAALGMVFHLTPKIWAKRANLIIAAICVAYGLSRFLMYKSGYGAYQPTIEAGLWLMLGASVVNLIMTAMAKAAKINP